MHKGHTKCQYIRILATACVCVCVCVCESVCVCVCAHGAYLWQSNASQNCRICTYHSHMRYTHRHTFGGSYMLGLHSKSVCHICLGYTAKVCVSYMLGLHSKRRGCKRLSSPLANKKSRSLLRRLSKRSSKVVSTYDAFSARCSQAATKVCVCVCVCVSAPSMQCNRQLEYDGFP
jgi:hypothetical protein